MKYETLKNVSEQLRIKPATIYGGDVKDLIQNFEQTIAHTVPSACPQLLGELERLKALLWGRMLHTNSAPAPQPDNGRYLTVQEVVARFGVTERWLYRHKRQMPHSQPSRKVLLFPEQAITRWIASRKGG